MIWGYPHLYSYSTNHPKYWRNNSLKPPNSLLVLKRRLKKGLLSKAFSAVHPLFVFRSWCGSPWKLDVREGPATGCHQTRHSNDKRCDGETTMVTCATSNWKCVNVSWKSSITYDEFILPTCKTVKTTSMVIEKMAWTLQPSEQVMWLDSWALGIQTQTWSISDGTIATYPTKVLVIYIYINCLHSYLVLLLVQIQLFALFDFVLLFLAANYLRRYPPPCRVGNYTRGLITCSCWEAPKSTKSHCLWDQLANWT